VRLLREQFWIVQVTGLAIVMALAGSATTTVLGMWILAATPAEAEVEDADVEEEDEEDEEFVEAPVVKPSSSVAADKQRTIDTILGRNAFCPTCVPETKGPATAVIADAPMPAGERPPLRLLATMESSDPSSSIATLYNTTTQTSGVFGIGDAILPGTQLVSVRGGVVTVGSGASTHQLRVGEAHAPVAAPKAEPTVDAKEKKDAKKSSIPGADEAIACASENVCDVEREFVESLLANPAALAGQAAVRPTADGFAFTRVKAGTLPHLLGLESGDVVTEVNGEALDSLDKAIGLATKLRNATNLSISLQRKGKLVQKEIRIS
jgi:type II secretory pathway component PulC